MNNALNVILLSESRFLLIGLAFVCEMLAMVIAYSISRQQGRASILMLVLAGIVTSAFFSALVSVTKFVADPDDILPAIVFWLMGSFASASYEKVWLMVVPVVLGGAGWCWVVLVFFISVGTCSISVARVIADSNLESQPQRGRTPLNTPYP